MPAQPTPSPDFAAQITVWAFVQHLGRPKTGRDGIQAPLHALAKTCRAWAPRAGHSTTFTLEELETAFRRASVHGTFRLRRSRGAGPRSGIQVDVRPQAVARLRSWVRAARTFGPLGDPLLAARRRAQAWEAYRTVQAAGGDQGALAEALKHVARVAFDESVIASDFDPKHPRFGAWLKAYSAPDLEAAAGWATLKEWHAGR